MRVPFAPAVVALIAVLPGLAVAQACPCGGGVRIQQPADVATLLGNKTVCATAGSDRWQEFHAGNTIAGGALTDYKKGPNHPIDPSKVVGSWSVTGQGVNTQVQYSYTGGQTYSYTVCQNGATVNFCGATNVVGATLSVAAPPCGPV
jgi:hypothetical protein